ncbi:peptidase T [Rhodopirellula sp. JC740]|uniref:Peptidase T n=1 Tax=Rhodopirellula halodulae TaxID=2894198 RepID=A0ABS8NMS5_9BACT|nr:peptidase T [Rhodopirellula sp. JC740]MCC9644868.1 peptidase T [Rhodopirellula sp. JC740]
MIQTDRLLERFLRYVKINTAADPQSAAYPSSERQRELASLLAEELRAMGLDDVSMDEHAVVIATVSATVEGNLPTVALVAHMDTSPEAPSESVNPQVVQSYPGGDLPLPHGNSITVDGCPDLKDMVGQTLVTTDGSTLLGGDDKAGVAIIMELAQTLVENPSLAHGPVRVVMTCDEEVGRGTEKLDLERLDATVAYTIDGGGHGVIDVETFSADAMTLIFQGHNIHPAIAKGRMVNSLRAASDFAASLPRDNQTPETTDGREGFIHLHDIVGGVGQTRVELILRSFDSEQLDTYSETVTKLAHDAVAAWPGMKVDITRRRQYRNLGDGLAKLPESISLAEEAFTKIGVDSKQAIIRGGTDGSQLTEMGLPTPNLSSGQHNIHSVLEFANLDEMVLATKHLVELLQLWSEKRC